MDDPTSSLDNQTAKRIMSNLKNGEEFKDKTIVMTTNDTNLFKFADRLIYISNGQIVFLGTFDKLQSEPQYKNLFNRVAKNKTTEVRLIRNNANFC